MIAMNAVGWYDNAAQTEPVVDPGLHVPCPVCGGTLNDDQPRVAISLMLKEMPERSYFFRAHKPCWSALSPEDQGLVEGDIIDAEVARLALPPITEGSK